MHLRIMVCTLNDKYFSSLTIKILCVPLKCEILIVTQKQELKLKVTAVNEMIVYTSVVLVQ